MIHRTLPPMESTGQINATGAHSRLREAAAVLALLLLLAPAQLFSQGKAAVKQQALPPLEILQRAHTLYSQGDYQDARKYYLQALPSFPNDFDILKDLAYCYFASGRRGYARAAVYYERALRVNPKASDVADRLNQCYMSLKRYDEAAAVAMKMAEMPDAPAEAWKRVAEAYDAANETDKAESAYSAYLQRNPGDLLARSNLGRLYAWSKDYARAADQYQIVLSTNPNFVPALVGMARLLSWQGQLDQSLALYERVLSRQPHNAEAESGKAFVLMWQSRPEDALPLFKDVHRRYPRDQEVSRGLAEARKEAEQRAFLAAKKAGDTSKIMAYYREKLAKNPKDLDALKALMSFNANPAHCEQSIAFGHQALQLSQGDPDVELALARSLTLCQNYTEAIDRYQDYLRSHPKAEGALYELGDTMLRARQTPQAVTVFQRLLKINPNNLDGQVGLGEALASTGQYDQALESFNQALKQAPKNYDALQGKAYILFYKNDFQEAHSIFESLEQQKPGDAQNAQELREIDAAEEQARWASLRPSADAPPQAWKKFYEKRLASYPDDRDAMKGLAYVNTELNNAPAAIQGYRRVLALYPGDRDSQLELARLLSLDGQYLASLNLYNEVLQSDPDDPKILDRVAQVQNWAGQYPQALGTYQKLLASDPTNTGYLLDVARLQARLKEYPAAKNTLASLLTQDPQNHAARLEIAQLDFSQGQLQNSLHNYEVLLKNNPKDPVALAGKATIDYRQGRLEEAATAGSQAAAAQPKNFDTLMLMANIEHARGHRKQTHRWLNRAAQISPANPEVQNLRTRLHQEEAITIHTVASFAREVAPPGQVILPALGFTNSQTGKSTTIFPQDVFPGRYGEDLSYQDFGTTIGMSLFPHVASFFTFSSLPTQSRTLPLCSVNSLEIQNVLQPGDRSCAVAPWMFISRHSWRASKLLTIRGSFGLARFGPSDFTQAYSLNGDLANLVNRFGPSILTQIGIGGTPGVQAAQPLPVSQAFHGSNVRPLGSAGATLTLSNNFSIDLDWNHSPAVYFPTPVAMNEHLFQTRYDAALNVVITPRTQLRVDFFHAKLSLGASVASYGFSFTNPTQLMNATVAGTAGPAAQVWPLFYAAPNPLQPLSGQSCPVVTLSDGTTQMTPFLINATPTSLLCALGKVTETPSARDDWGNGAEINFNRVIFHRTLISADAGYRGTFYGFSKSREPIQFGFFHPAFYQNQMATGRIYGQLFGPVSYDISGGIGFQQTDHGTAITRSGTITPSFSFKINRNLTLGVSYTHYNSAQIIGPLRGNAFAMTTDWKF